MIRSILRSQFFRAPVFLKSSIPTRLYDSTSSVFQQTTDFFDLADELVEVNLGKPKKKPKGKSSKEWDEETKLRVQYATRKNLVQKFKHFFGCSEEQARAITFENKKLLKITLPRITEKIEILFKWNVTAKSILENPWLLEVPISKL